MVNDILVRAEQAYRAERVRSGVRRPRELARIRRGGVPAAWSTRPRHPEP